MEAELSIALFHRKGNRIMLTAQGEKLLKYVQEMEDLDFKIKNEVAGKASVHNEWFKIGASTTIANYILPKIYKDLVGFKGVEKFELISGNSSDIEEKIIEHTLHLGIVENTGKNTLLRYLPFAQDEIVLVAKHNHKIKEEITTEQLSTLPIIAREYGSGTQKVIEEALNKISLRLSPIAILDNTEGIKTILKNTNCLSFLSIHAVSEEILKKELKIVEIKGMNIKRIFNFIVRQGFPLDHANAFIERIKQSYCRRNRL